MRAVAAGTRRWLGAQGFGPATGGDYPSAKGRGKSGYRRASTVGAVSKRRDRATPRAATQGEKGHEAVPSPTTASAGIDRELLGRLYEERQDRDENKWIWRTFREAPGWLTAGLLLLATAVDVLIAARGNPQVAIEIASSMDTSNLFLMATVAFAINFGALAPFYFGLYFRNELALRYRDMALAKASGDELHDNRVLTNRLRNILLLLAILVALSCMYAPAWLSLPISCLILFGMLDGIRSPFAPWNFWERLQSQGHLALPKDQLWEVIRTKVEISNLRRANGVFFIAVVFVLLLFLVVPGNVLPFQNIKLKNKSTLVGSVLSSTPPPADLIVLQYEPRRVVIVNPNDINSREYCSVPVPQMEEGRTLLEIVRHSRVWKPPACG